MVKLVRIRAQNRGERRKKRQKNGDFRTLLLLQTTLMLLFIMLVMKQWNVLYLPLHPGGDLDHQETIFAALGEIPESILQDESLSVVPVYGNWSHNAWRSAYSQLHGNNMKIICYLKRGGTILTRASDNSEVLLPYKVLMRPVHNGGGNEYLAYKVAQELGIQERIPTQTIPPRPFPIDTPWTAANNTDYVNIQSLVSNVQLTFLGDDWTRCIPTITNTNSEAKLSIHNNKDDDFLHLVLDNTTTMAPLSIKTIDVDTRQDWKCCFRNMSVYDKTWRKECLQRDFVRYKCENAHVAQLLEMATFDALISNRERLHIKGGSSNNVHWITPSSHDDKHPLLQHLVWLDHGHYTFSNDNARTQQHEMMDLLQQHCVFPRDLLLRNIYTFRDPKLSIKVFERLSVQMIQALGGQASIMERLRIVDQQVARLEEIILSCVRENSIHVISTK